jgi:hypothetical protein
MAQGFRPCAIFVGGDDIAEGSAVGGGSLARLKCAGTSG